MQVILIMDTEILSLNSSPFPERFLSLLSFLLRGHLLLFFLVVPLFSGLLSLLFYYS